MTQSLLYCKVKTLNYLFKRTQTIPYEQENSNPQIRVSFHLHQEAVLQSWCGLTVPNCLGCEE